MAETSGSGVPSTKTLSHRGAVLPFLLTGSRWELVSATTVCINSTFDRLNFSRSPKKTGLSMFSIIAGLVFIAFTVFACLPKDVFGFGLEWGEYVVQSLKGTAPVLSLLVGIIAIMLGFTDIRDKREAKREEEEALMAEQNDKQKEEKSKKADK